MTLRLLLALIVAWLGSCRDASELSSSAALDFLVESDRGVPLPRAEISLDGVRVGKTDVNGSLRTTIQTTPGAEVRIEHDCPDGFLDPVEAKRLRVRNYQAIGSSQPPAMQISLRCPPLKRRAAFVVRARGGANLPVLLNGDLVARTNGQGVAQFTVLDVPGSEFIVKIETEERPRLLPRSPTHLFALSDLNEVFVTDQSFESRKAARLGRFRRKRILKIE